MRRIALILVPIPSFALAAPSSAAPKPIKQTVPFRDATPDPSGSAVGSDGHGSGLLPRKAPIAFKTPAAGKLEVSIRGFHRRVGAAVEMAEMVLAANPTPEVADLAERIKTTQTPKIVELDRMRQQMGMEAATSSGHGSSDDADIPMHSGMMTDEQMKMLDSADGVEACRPVPHADAGAPRRRDRLGRAAAG